MNSQDFQGFVLVSASNSLYYFHKSFHLLLSVRKTRFCTYRWPL